MFLFNQDGSSDVAQTFEVGISLVSLPLSAILLNNRTQLSYFLIFCHLSEMQNMWDLTPDTDLLLELPEEYNFEAAIADLIVSSLTKQTINSIFFMMVLHISTLTLLFIYYQDNALQAVWFNGKNNRKLVRYSCI